MYLLTLLDHSRTASGRKGGSRVNGFADNTYHAPPNRAEGCVRRLSFPNELGESTRTWNS
jgi:hypothetical protein